jgi:hypothetical protein
MTAEHVIALKQTSIREHVADVSGYWNHSTVARAMQAVSAGKHDGCHISKVEVWADHIVICLKPNEK